MAAVKFWRRPCADCAGKPFMFMTGLPVIYRLALRYVLPMDILNCNNAIAKISRRSLEILVAEAKAGWTDSIRTFAGRFCLIVWRSIVDFAGLPLFRSNNLYYRSNFFFYPRDSKNSI
jgi:hypothetical protein